MSFHVFMCLLSYVFGLLKTIKEFLLLLLLHHCIPLAPVGSFSSAPPWPPGSLASAWLVGSPSLPRAPPPPALRPSLLHGSSLHRLHYGPSSWLWPGSCCAPPALGPSWLLPHSSPPLSSVCRPPPGCPSSSRATSQVPTRPSSCCFHSARTHLLGGGDVSGLWTCLCGLLLPVTQFLPHVQGSFFRHILNYTGYNQ